MMTKIVTLCLFGMLCIQLSTQETSTACTLPKESGPCRALEPKVYYNSETGYCEVFFYGGCDGNANRFDDVQACTDACGGTAPPARK